MCSIRFTHIILGTFYLLCKLFCQCVHWPIIASIGCFGGLSWFKHVSCTYVQAGTFFSVHTDGPISRQDLSLCAVTSWLTLPFTELKKRFLNHNTHNLLRWRLNLCNTHSQVLTGARTGWSTATERCSWDKWAWSHWKPKRHLKNTASEPRQVWNTQSLSTHRDSGLCYSWWLQCPAPHRTSPPALE